MSEQRSGWSTSDDQTARDWARAAQRGDARAFDRLAGLLRPRLYRWALLRTLDPDDAEDVVQTALLRMHRALPAYRGGARVGTWVYTLVRSAAIDLFRGRSRRQSRQERFARDQPAAAAGAPGAEPELLALVRAALTGLPPRQRIVFDMADLQDYAPAEIAELLGMNPNTVRVHLLRARRTVRQRLLQAHPSLLEDR